MKTLQTEYIVVVKKSSPFCKNIKTFNNLLTANDDIEIKAAKLRHKKLEVDYEIYESELTDKDLRFLALPFLTGKWVKGNQDMQAKRVEIAVAISATVERFDFEIDTFGEAIVVAAIEIVENLLPPVSQRFCKRVQGLELTGFHLSYPGKQSFFCTLIIQLLIEQIPEGFFEFITSFQGWRSIQHAL